MYNNGLFVLNKFDTTGVLISYIPNITYNSNIKKLYLKYKNQSKTLDFLGSNQIDYMPYQTTSIPTTKMEPTDINYKITPAMSFGTPVVNKNNKMYGVGHLKINLSEHVKYKENSNIDNFRRELKNNLSKLDRQYIEHFGTETLLDPRDCDNGYIYMMYFYYFNKNNISQSYDKDTNIFHDDFKMYISNAFLPINSKSKNKYIFSLVFPIGAYDEDDNLVITSGEGDFYNSQLTISFDNFQKLCVHDVTDIDMNDYKYQFLVDNTHISNQIN